MLEKIKFYMIIGVYFILVIIFDIARIVGKSRIFKKNRKKV